VFIIFIEKKVFSRSMQKHPKGGMETTLESLPDDALADVASFLVHERHIGAFACTSRRHRAVAERAIHPTTLLWRAARWGCTDAVRALLANPRTDPTARNHYALRCSVEFGHADVVHALMDDGRVDPTAIDGGTLVRTCENGHSRVLELVWRHRERADCCDGTATGRKSRPVRTDADVENRTTWLRHAKGCIEEHRRQCNIRTYAPLIGAVALALPVIAVVAAVAGVRWATVAGVLLAPLAWQLSRRAFG
jgi:hypothetical protein